MAVDVNKCQHLSYFEEICSIKQKMYECHKHTLFEVCLCHLTVVPYNHYSERWVTCDEKLQYRAYVECFARGNRWHTA